MAEFIRVKNVHTGAVANLPKAALRHFPDFAVDESPDPDRELPEVTQPKPKKNLRRASDAEPADATAPDDTDAVSTASNEKE